MANRDIIFTAHNVLFTVLNLGFLWPKAVLTVQGKSVGPNILDLTYGFFISTLFYWLGEYRDKEDPRMEWYFRKYFPALVQDSWRNLGIALTQFSVAVRSSFDDVESRSSSTSPTIRPTLSHPCDSWLSNSAPMSHANRSGSGSRLLSDQLPPSLHRRAFNYPSSPDTPVLVAPSNSMLTAFPITDVEDDSNTTIPCNSALLTFPGIATSDSSTSSTPSNSSPWNSPVMDRDPSSNLFEEEDIWHSWRKITKEKLLLQDGVRLESAIWRLWLKQLNHLQTMSEGDLDWLYRPLHNAFGWTMPLYMHKLAIHDVDRSPVSVRPDVPTTPSSKPRSRVRSIADPPMDGWRSFERASVRSVDVKGQGIPRLTDEFAEFEGLTLRTLRGPAGPAGQQVQSVSEQTEKRTQCDESMRPDRGRSWKVIGLFNAAASSPRRFEEGDNSQGYPPLAPPQQQLRRRRRRSISTSGPMDVQRFQPRSRSRSMTSAMEV